MPPTTAPDPIRATTRRAWIACAAVAAFMLLFSAAGFLAPPPWWRREAGAPPEPFYGLSWVNGFFATTDGWLLTTADAVRGCRRISIGNATLSALEPDRIRVSADPSSDLALLHVATRAPAALPLSGAVPDRPAAVTLLGFPDNDHGTVPHRVRGSLADVAAGPDRDPGALRLLLPRRAEPDGAPALADDGTVLGLAVHTVPAPRPDATVATMRAIPAPAAAAALRDAAAGAAPATATPDPAAAIVRVFCFHDSLFGIRTVPSAPGPAPEAR